MKKRRLIYALVLIAGAMLISEMAISKLNGLAASNGALAGDPGGQNCTKCHSTGSTVKTGDSVFRVFMLDTMATGFTYTPGSVHTVKYRIYATNNVGFVATALKADNTNAGTLDSLNNGQTKPYTVTANSRTYISHKTGANTGPYKEYSFKWTAPAVGTGSVKFYISSLSGDGADDMDNDTIYDNVYTIAEKSSVGINTNTKVAFSVFPNPANDKINVNFSNAVSGQMNVTIYSIDGKQSINLMNEQLSNTSKSLTFDLPAGIQSGIYFVRIENAGMTSVQKILVN